MQRYASTAWRRLGPASCVVVLLLATGCLVDASDRCSPGERVNGDGYCVCKPNHVPIPRDLIVLVATPERPLGRTGCLECGDHQTAQGDACVCDDGYALNDESTCVKAAVPMVNFGDSCLTDSDCSGPGASCIDDDVLGGETRAAYCSTSSCKDQSECPAGDGFGCFAGASGMFCRKPPSGEGDACDMANGSETNPACVLEATVCAFGRCTAPIVCADHADCTPGLICCDLRQLAGRDDALICTTSDACLTD